MVNHDDSTNAFIPRVESDESSSSDQKKKGQAGKKRPQENGPSQSSASSDQNNDEQDEQPKQNDSFKKRFKQVKQTVGAAKACLFGALALKMASAAKAVMGFMKAMFSHLIQLIGHIIHTAAATLTSMFVSATGLWVPLVIGSLVIGGIGATTAVWNESEQRKKDDLVVENACIEDISQMRDSMAEIDQDVEKVESARKVFSVLKTYGLNNAQIAGVLGNWDIESGIDPTTIEGIYDEPYDFNGVRHKKAMADLNDHTVNYIFPQYNASGANYSPSGYLASDGKYYPGLGMGQYTGPGALNFINDAASLGTEWYTIQFQMAYTFVKGSPARGGGISWWETYAEQSGSASDMAVYFTREWEGNTRNKYAERQQMAEVWFKEIEGWVPDSAVANTIFAMARKIGNNIEVSAISRKQDDCVQAIQYSQPSSIYEAAVSFAHLTTGNAMGNNGTELYVEIHDRTLPSLKGQDYTNPAAAVAAAVRWSGYDDGIAYQTPVDMKKYLASKTDRWKIIGTADTLDKNKIAAGDIFVSDTDAFVYVENHGSEITDSVKAQSQEYSPALLKQIDAIIGQSGEYTVYRCYNPQYSHKYADVVAGLNAGITGEGSYDGPEYIRIPGRGTIKIHPRFERYSKPWTRPWNAYAGAFEGQCTWFAAGVFGEIYNMPAPFSGNGYSCAEELLRNAPDRFESGSVPMAGSIVSSSFANNHVFVVLTYDKTTDRCLVAEGNLDGSNNPWEVAIHDYWIKWRTMDDLRATYGNLTIANPKAHVKFAAN